MYNLSAKDQKIIIVISEFNTKIIERLLQDSELRVRLGKTAQAHAEKFKWEETALALYG